MQYLLDTANLDQIEKFCDCLPIAGVTTNPSIIKKEGCADFFAHMRAIRAIIGKQKQLHIQVIAQDAQDILRDADAILERVDEHAYIKVPATMEGLKAIRLLKARGNNATATAIYTAAQGFLAIEAGADYLAPYYNRMEGLNIDAESVIRAFAQMIERYGYAARVVAASFKGMGQVNKAFLAGAHAVTLDPTLLKDALSMPDILKAVEDFDRDWKSVYGDKRISQL